MLRGECLGRSLRSRWWLLLGKRSLSSPASACHTGDRTSNLMWRLLNGELPQKKIPQVVGLMIGKRRNVGWPPASPQHMGTGTELSPQTRVSTLFL